MPEIVKIYDSSAMDSSYSDDSSFSSPVSFGSLSVPLDGVLGEVSSPFSFWVKNISTTKKLTNVSVSGIASQQGGGGGEASSIHAYVELALDDNSNLPNSQAVAPTEYEAAEEYQESAYLVVSNVIDASGVVKSETTYTQDDDYRTMMPDEYSIMWVRCDIDETRTLSGLPADSGIKNIKISVNADVEDV